MVRSGGSLPMPPSPRGGAACSTAGVLRSSSTRTHNLGGVLRFSIRMYHRQTFRQRMIMPEPISEYEQERRGKLQKLRELGVDPYGQRTAGLQPLAQIKALHKPEFGQDGGPVVKAAGRIMLKRDMGKL